MTRRSRLEGILSVSALTVVRFAMRGKICASAFKPLKNESMKVLSCFDIVSECHI